jgi:hypothetical protein
VLDKLLANFWRAAYFYAGTSAFHYKGSDKVYGWLKKYKRLMIEINAQINYNLPQISNITKSKLIEVKNG